MALRSLRERIEEEAEVEWVMPEDPSPQLLAARSQQALGAWRRLMRRLGFMLRTLAHSAVLSIWCAEGALEEAPTSPPPEEQASSSTSRARRPPRRDDLCHVGDPLPPSTRGPFEANIEECEHPQDKMAARGGQGTFWWTCLACGSRWTRTQAPRQRLTAAAVASASAAAAAGPPLPPPAETPTVVHLGTAPPSASGHSVSARGSAAARRMQPQYATPPWRPELDPEAFGPAPFCRACGHVTVLRQNNSHYDHFWGCSMFPRCRATQQALLVAGHRMTREPSEAGMSMDEPVFPDQ